MNALRFLFDRVHGVEWDVHSRRLRNAEYLGF